MARSGRNVHVGCIELENEEGSPNLLRLEIPHSIGGVVYLDAADRQWLRDELAKWDRGNCQHTDARGFHCTKPATDGWCDDHEPPVKRVANESRPLSLCEDCIQNTRKEDGSQLCTRYNTTTRVACIHKHEPATHGTKGKQT
jgi:hypothetical protein